MVTQNVLVRMPVDIQAVMKYHCTKTQQTIKDYIISLVVDNLKKEHPEMADQLEKKGE